jgi:hypothetical protein
MMSIGAPDELKGSCPVRGALGGNLPGESWARRLRSTLFCQAFDTTADEEDETSCVLWEGMAFQSMTTVDVLQACVGQFATIPEEIYTQLRSDQEHATPRSPLQDKMLRMFQEHSPIR